MRISSLSDACPTCLQVIPQAGHATPPHWVQDFRQSIATDFERHQKTVRFNPHVSEYTFLNDFTPSVDLRRVPHDLIA
jgi:hypothetical protein